MIEKHPYIILFDGYCNLCNSSVQFIIKRDPKPLFKFANLESLAAQELQKKFGLDIAQMDSIIYFKEEDIYFRSTAVLLICKELKGLWPLFYGFIIIPRPLRDGIYKWIAKNRYQWFGKKEECMVPDENINSRFLN